MIIVYFEKLKKKNQKTSVGQGISYFGFKNRLYVGNVLLLYNIRSKTVPLIKYVK